MKKIIMQDADEFVNKTNGWNQLIEISSYRHVKFSIMLYRSCLKDLFVCEGATFRYYRLWFFGLDIYRKETKLRGINFNHFYYTD